MASCRKPIFPASVLRQQVRAEVRHDATSFFLSRQTLIASEHPGMAIWREKLFAGCLETPRPAMEFFKLPTNRVVELGSQVEITLSLVEMRPVFRLL